MGTREQLTDMSTLKAIDGTWSLGCMLQVVPGKADKKPDSHEHALQAYSNGQEVPYR